MLRKHLHLASASPLARPWLASEPCQHVAQFRAGILLSGVGLSYLHRAGVGIAGYFVTALPPLQLPYLAPTRMSSMVLGFLTARFLFLVLADGFFCCYRHSGEMVQTKQ